MGYREGGRGKRKGKKGREEKGREGESKEGEKQKGKEGKRNGRFGRGERIM